MSHYAILASWCIEHDCKLFLSVQIIMGRFNFDMWCTATKLTETSVDILKKEDLDTRKALQLLTQMNLENLGLSIGQKCVLEVALKKLQKDVNEKPSPGDATGASDTITTKSLVSNGGLEEILKKVESAGSLDESLLAQDRPTYPQQNHQR